MCISFKAAAETRADLRAPTPGWGVQRQAPPDLLQQLPANLHALPHRTGHSLNEIIKESVRTLPLRSIDSFHLAPMPSEELMPLNIYFKISPKT